MSSWESGLWIWSTGFLFAVTHSILASQGCKQWGYRHGLPEPRYRLLYSIFALFATAIWIFFIHQLPDAPLYQHDGFIWMLMVSVQILGVTVALAAFQPVDGLVFLGLRKASTGTDPFIVRGIYRWLRHPMYAGVMLILLAMPEQTHNGFQFTLIVCAYFIIGSRFEEKRMLKEHPEYVHYQASVAAFIPCKAKR